jgi:hypothetical protein
MSFWRRISPRGAFADLVHEWKQPTPHRWQILGVSVAATFALLTLFIPESQRRLPEKPEVTWISTFASDRTEAEIIRSNLANQQKQDAFRAAQAKAEARRKEIYRTIGRASGFDVDELERQYSDAPAAAQSAAPSPSSNPATGER